MGDSFNNISNSVIATRGSIIQGVKIISQQGQEDIANALSDLEKLISKIPNAELPDHKKAESLELLNGVVQEAAKPSPSKSMLKALGNGLWEAIKSIPTILGSAEKLWPIISKLWV
jgi:hypothetical protein